MTTGGEKSTDKQPVLFLEIAAPGLSSDENSRLNGEVRNRLLNIDYQESINDLPELTFSLENEDLFWYDENGGADLLALGSLVTFQFGYMDAQGEDLDNLSFIRTFSIVEYQTLGRNVVGIKANSEAQNRLNSQVKPQWYEKTKVSEVVRKILGENGFDDDHRIIQDTKYEEDRIASTPNQTLLSFIYELAQPYNYRFYITPRKSDKTPVAHFHKPGYVAPPSTATPKEGAPPTPTFATKGSGHASPVKTIIRYRPSPPVDSDVLDFSLSLKPGGTASSVTAVGVNPKEGTSFSETVTEKDKKEEPLSSRTPYASPALVAAAEGKAARVEPELPSPEEPVKKTDKKAGDVTPSLRYEAGAIGAVPSLVLFTDSTPTKAKEHAEAMLETAQSFIVELAMTLVGRPDILAGDIVKVEGLKKFSNNYLVQRVTHSYDGGSSAFRTTLGLTTDGVNDKYTPESERSKGKAPPPVLAITNAAGTDIGKGIGLEIRSGTPATLDKPPEGS